MDTRTPPHSAEAEQSVLGSLLIDPDAFTRVAPTLQGEDFYREKHRLIYQAVSALRERAEPVDVQTVWDELARKGQGDASGGPGTLAELLNAVPTSLHIEQYAKVVSRLALRRKMIAAGRSIESLGYDDEGDLDTDLVRAESKILSLSDRRQNGAFHPVGEHLHAYLDRVDFVSKHHGQPVGVPSGFYDLDRLLGGFQPSDLVIVGARPAVGKTALLLSIAHTTAVKHHTTVGIFSLEMSAQQVVQRLVAMEGNVDQQCLKTGYIEDDQWQRIIAACGILAEAPIYLEDSSALTVADVRAKARRLAADAPLGLLIVDYLQLMRGKARERVQEIGEISRGLKALAKELNVPVLAAAQLSRGIESREKHIPLLSDLRESGSLEQDSDVVMFIHREEVYHPEKGGDGETSIIIAKHRNGPTGTIGLRWLPRVARYVDSAAAWEPGA